MYAGVANPDHVQSEANHAMALLKIEQIDPGMVVAEHVQDRRGRLLIPAGVELEERHLRSFRMWGVTHVEVHGEERDDDTDLPAPWAITAAEAELAGVFRHTDVDHPFMAHLYRCATLRRARAHEQEGHFG